MPFESVYPSVPAEVIVGFFVMVMLIGLLSAILWFKVYVYSPDKVYRINRRSGWVAKSLFCPEKPWSEEDVWWEGLGFARDKTYFLKMWGQGLMVDVEENVIEERPDRWGSG